MSRNIYAFIVDKRDCIYFCAASLVFINRQQREQNCRCNKCSSLYIFLYIFHSLHAQCDFYIIMLLFMSSSIYNPFFLSFFIDLINLDRKYKIISKLYRNIGSKFCQIYLLYHCLIYRSCELTDYIGSIYFAINY